MESGQRRGARRAVEHVAHAGHLAGHQQVHAVALEVVGNLLMDSDSGGRVGNATRGGSERRRCAYARRWKRSGWARLLLVRGGRLERWCELARNAVGGESA